MGEALFELENILRSKKEKLTSQEANILMQCKSNAVRDFTFGATGAGTVATRKLLSVHRLFLTAGGSFFFGLWTFGRSLDSSLNYILSLDRLGCRKSWESVTDDRASNSEKSDQERTVQKKSNPEPKQAQMNTAADAAENPFDCIFGIPAEVDEIHQTSRFNAGRSKATSKRHVHGNKRSHRRHRKHHQEASEA